MNEAKSVAGSAVATIMTAVGMTSTNEILELVSLILTITGAVLNLVIIPLIKWLKRAKMDGKITADELKEGADTLSKGIEGVKDTINKKED